MAATLVVFKKNGQRKDIPLKRGITLVGRRTDCDVRIPLLTVSRKHCRIIQKEGKTVVQDLGSANGTFINSQRVMEAVISAGDRLSIGSLTFTVQVDGHPQHIAPPPDGEEADKSGDPLDSSAPELSGISGTQVEAPPETAADPLTDLEPLAGDLDDGSGN